MAWLEELAAGAGLTPMEEDPFYQRVTGPHLLSRRGSM